MTATNAGDASYVIQTGAAAHDRLELIARLLWPTTETFLERAGAFDVARFVDVGCGIGDVASRVAERGVRDVTGIDVDAEVVAAAAERSAQRGSGAVFRSGALDDLGRDADLRDFDAVYARCVLSHQPDPAKGLAAMIAAARDGATIAVEDVEVAAVWSSPPSEALARHVELYVAAALGLGARPDVGCELAVLLRDLGATDIDVEIVQPVLRVPADLQIHARTMEAIAGPIIEQGLATETEVAEIVAELDRFAATPGVFATLPRLIQVSARAPRA
jgi:2-polyprenyl-3-methyl-5-hydroxy-6-metoxy-1,4-benzoquinol methylase